MQDCSTELIMNVLSWPARSSDMHFIESVWSVHAWDIFGCGWQKNDLMQLNCTIAENILQFVLRYT